MRKRSLAFFAGALIVLILPTSALALKPAAPSHELELILAGVIEPGPKPVPPPEGQYEDACGVALDSTGNIYISDYYKRLIYIYDSGPQYLEQLNVEDPDGPCNLAFDAAGDLYVNNWRRNVVRYTPGGASSVIDSARSTGVTYDPASDRIYVDDRTYIAVYEPSGAPVMVEGTPLRIGIGSLQSGYGVAVSDFPATEGNVYVPDAAAGLVRVYGPGGEELAPIEGLGTPQHGFSSLVDSNVLVTPSDGHVYVADNLEPGFEHPAAAVDEFNPTGEYRGQLPHALIHAEPTAFALGPNGNIYATSGNDERAILYGFGPTFAAHRLEASTSGEGSGHVASEPAGIACPPACAAEYNVGEEVILAAVAEPGSVFSGWSGGGCSGTGLCHTTMSADKAISAEFSLAPVVPLQAVAQATSLSTASESHIASGVARSASSSPMHSTRRHHRRRHHPARSHRARYRGRFG